MTLQQIQQRARQQLAERTRRVQQLEAAQVFVQQARAARCPDYYQWSASQPTTQQRRIAAFWRQLAREV
jgi:hypothetical protein